MTELQINQRWNCGEKIIKNALQKEKSFKKKQYNCNIAIIYSNIKLLIEHGEEQEVITILKNHESDNISILNYDPSINNNDFTRFFSVKYCIINIIIRCKQYSLFLHILTYYPEIIINTSVAHDLILSNDVEFFNILKTFENIGFQCLNQFCYCYPYKGYSFMKPKLKKIHKKMLKNVYFEKLSNNLHFSNNCNKCLIDGIDVLYYTIIHNSNDIIEIVYNMMYDITRDNYVIWNNNTITPSQLYLKKHLISIPTFNILNSSKFFTKVSICDLKWAIQKHFLLFLKSYSILILSNVLKRKI